MEILINSMSESALKTEDAGSSNSVELVCKRELQCERVGRKRRRVRTRGEEQRGHQRPEFFPAEHYS